MVTKREIRKTQMKPKSARTTRASAPEETNKSNGQSIKTENASNAIATITANIAATSISLKNIDHTPIIEEERVPEDNALVSFFCASHK